MPMMVRGADGRLYSVSGEVKSEQVASSTLQTEPVSSNDDLASGAWDLIPV